MEPPSPDISNGEGSNPRSLMEAILAQKMARASAKFMRSTSTASIDSVCSGRSHSSETQARTKNYQ